MNKGWMKQRLVSITEKITDGSHNPPKGVTESDYMMLSSKNVFDDNFHYDGPRYLTAEQFQQEHKRTGIIPGDVLLTIVGTVGRCAVVPTNAPKITLQRSVAVIRPISKFILPRFLMYSFIQRNEELNAQARGVAQKGIYLETLRDMEVLLPPQPEQLRIVAILDGAFEGIATAKANAEKNLKNARQLFESHLNSVFSQRGEEWPRIRIEDTCESIIDCVNKTAPKVDESTPFKMIRTTNVRNGFVCLDSVYSVTEDVFRIWTRRQIPKRGDVILTREAPMGEVGMLLSDDQVFLGQRIVSYRADASKLDNHFLLYALQSEDLQKQIRSLASGSTVQHMRVPDSKNLQLPFPSLNTQRGIATQLNTLREKTQRLESIYQKKIAALDALKKAILQKAFSGKL